MSIFLFILFVAIAYLCGSICSAIIVSRIFSLPDPCTEGSKNPGATNVLRLAGKKYAAIVLGADMLKGFLPVFLANICGSGPGTVACVALAAVIGHMYPVFFEFKGGKGVATALGALVGLHFILGIVIMGIWLLVANFSRHSSLASLIAIMLAPLFAVAGTGSANSFPPLLLMTVLIFYQHRANISRLIDGTEPKIQLRHPQFSDVAEDLITGTESKPPQDQESPEEPAPVDIPEEIPSEIPETPAEVPEPPTEVLEPPTEEPVVEKTDKPKSTE